MNKVELLGRLTKDPEVRYTSGMQTMVSSFNLAVNRRFVKEGEERQTDFISVAAFGKTAEFIQKYFKKGIQIALVGRLQTRNWDDQNGNKHYATEVIAEEVYFADSIKKDASNPEDILSAPPSPSNDLPPISPDDDLPF